MSRGGTIPVSAIASSLSRRAAGFELAIQHDTVLQPWQRGGPLVNLEGKAVGLNIARAGRVASYALPAGFISQLVERLKRQQQMPVAREHPSS
jgi:serine protease Do